MAYKILIQSESSGNVSAYLPDEFALSVEHRWENPFEVDMSKEMMAGLQWLTGRGVFDPSKVGDALGMDTFVYMGSSPVQVSWELEFVVNNSIANELTVPVKKLVRMSCPSPGSASTLATLGKPETVTINVPGIIYIRKAYITSVGVNMMKPLVTDGDKTVPMRTRVPISFLSAYILTKDRADEMLFPD